MKKIKKIALILTCFCLLKNAAYAMENIYEKDIYEEKKETTINTEDKKNEETEINTEKKEEKKEEKENTTNKEGEKNKENEINTKKVEEKKEPEIETKINAEKEKKETTINTEEKDKEKIKKDEKEKIIIFKVPKIQDEKENNLINEENMKIFSENDNILKQYKEDEIKKFLDIVNEKLKSMEINKKYSYTDYVKKCEEEFEKLQNKEKYTINDIYNISDFFLKIIPILKTVHSTIKYYEYLTISQKYPTIYKEDIKNTIEKAEYKFNDFKQTLSNFTQNYLDNFISKHKEYIEKLKQENANTTKEEIIKQIKEHTIFFKSKKNKLKKFIKQLWNKIKQFEKEIEEYKIYNSKNQLHDIVLRIYDPILSLYFEEIQSFDILYNNIENNYKELITDQLKEIKKFYEKFKSLKEYLDVNIIQNDNIKKLKKEDKIYMVKNKIHNYIDNFIGEKSLTYYRQYRNNYLFLNTLLDLIEKNKEKIYNNKKLKENEKNLYPIKKDLEDLFLHTAVTNKENKIFDRENKIFHMIKLAKPIKRLVSKYKLEDLYGARINYIVDLFNNFISIKPKYEKCLKILNNVDNEKRPDDIKYNIKYIELNLCYLKKLKEIYENLYLKIKENIDLSLEQDPEIKKIYIKELNFALDAAVKFFMFRIKETYNIYIANFENTPTIEISEDDINRFSELKTIFVNYFNYFVEKKHYCIECLKKLQKEPEKGSKNSADNDNCKKDIEKINDENFKAKYNNFYKNSSIIEKLHDNYKICYDQYKKNILNYHANMLGNLNKKINELIGEN